MNQFTSDYCEKINKTHSVIDGFTLPSWDELPKIYLYMDQVIELIGDYFRPLSLLAPGENPLTSPMINNYVKLKAMPAPEKKRYTRVHLAYLIIITSLKQSMSIASLKNIIPVCTNEEEVRSLYTAFVASHKSASDIFAKNIKSLSCADENSAYDSVVSFMIFENYVRLFINSISSDKNSALSEAEDKNN